MRDFLVVALCVLGFLGIVFLLCTRSPYGCKKGECKGHKFGDRTGYCDADSCKVVTGKDPATVERIGIGRVNAGTTYSAKEYRD